jgi:hypothetical protein
MARLKLRDIVDGIKGDLTQYDKVSTTAPSSTYDDVLATKKGDNYYILN